MNRPNAPALSVHQRNLLAASQAAAGRARDAVAARAGEAPQPGDLYRLEATADFPVHWLLLEESSPAAFRAAPADTHPLLGPHDLLVDSPLGPLRLRLAAEAEIARAALRPDLCLGAVSSFELARARRRRDSAVDEKPAAPELAGWLEEVIHPARSLAAAPRPAAVQELPRRARLRPWLFALAAGVLGLVGAGAGWLGWSAAQSRQEGPRLAARQAAAREKATLEAALAGREASERRLRQRLAELESAAAATAAASPEPLLNLPVAILYPASALRGEADEAYRWPPQSPYLTVVLKLAESETWPRYRVVVRPAGKARILWQSAALTLSDQGALQLALSRQQLPPGSYDISAQGLRDGRVRDLAAYGLKITR